MISYVVNLVVKIFHMYCSLILNYSTKKLITFVDWNGQMWLTLITNSTQRQKIPTSMQVTTNFITIPWRKSEFISI